MAEEMAGMLVDLLAAIKSRKVDTALDLLKRAPALARMRSEAGESPLLISIYYGVAEVTQALLDLGAGAGADLWEATAAGLSDRVQELVSREPARISTEGKDGFTPLALACFFGHREIAAYLLGQGAPVNVVSRNGLANTPLHAALAGRHTEIARMLMEAGAAVDAPDGEGNTPLHIAAGNGLAEMVTLLLERGASPNSRTEKGVTPLAVAAARGQNAVTQILRQAGGQEE